MVFIVLEGDDEQEWPSVGYSDEKRANLYVERLVKHSNYINQYVSARVIEMPIDETEPLDEVIEYDWIVHFDEEGNLVSTYGMFIWGERREIAVTPVRFPNRPQVAVSGIYASTREEAVELARKHL